MEYMNDIVGVLQPSVLAATLVSLLFIIKMVFLRDNSLPGDEEK